MVASENRNPSVYFFLLGVDTGYLRTVELPLDYIRISACGVLFVRREPSSPVSRSQARAQVRMWSSRGRAQRAHFILEGL